MSRRKIKNTDPNYCPRVDSHSRHHKTGKWMIWIAWLSILAIGFVFFKWHEIKNNGAYNTVSTKNQSGLIEVRIPITDNNRYEVFGYINNIRVTFLIDTGATSLALAENVATKAGLQKGMPVTIITAGGSKTGYLTNVPTLVIGIDPRAQIVVHNIPATINPDMHADTILLGMGTLKQLDLVQTKDTLILRQNP